MNSYLTPLVEELREFWNGQLVQVTKGSVSMNLRVRLALSCVACDIPAARKVSGFVGHAPRLGCSKCVREFTGNDYSGYGRHTW